MDELHHSDASWFPKVRYAVFFFTLVVAIILMLLLSLPGSQGLMTGSAGGILDLVTWSIDPIIVHVVGLFGVAVLLRPIIGRFTRLRGLWAWGLSLFLPSLLLVMVYAFTEGVLKPSFDYSRPEPNSRLGAPWLTALLHVDMPTDHDSCPSGFVVRQMFLLMLGIVLCPGFLTDGEKTKNVTTTERILLMVLFVTVAYTAFSRVYRGFHTWYDVGISLSVSCYMFWFFYYLLSVIARRMPDEMDVGIAAATCILVPSYLYYSQDAHWWLIIGISAFCIIGVTRVIPRHEDSPYRASEAHQGEASKSGDQSSWS